MKVISQSTHSYTQRSYKGEAKEQSDRVSVGGKELSGYSENNHPLIEPYNKDTQRFTTHYQQRFSDPIVSNVTTDVQLPTSNGFCKGTIIHEMNDCHKKQLNTLDPYVARYVV